MDSFVAYRSRKKMTLLLLGSLIAVIMGLRLVGAFGAVQLTTRFGHSLSPEASIAKGWTIGGPTVLFFGLCALYILGIMFKTGVVLRIDTKGILWTRWSDKVIPWGEIIDVHEQAVGRTRFIHLKLRNPDRYPGRGILQLLAKANRGLTGADIAITTNDVDHSLDETIAAIELFRQNYTRRANLPSTFGRCH